MNRKMKNFMAAKIKLALTSLKITPRSVLNHYSRRDSKSLFLLKLRLKIATAFRPKQKNAINYSRIAWALTRPCETHMLESDPEILPKIDLVFVATVKDFAILPFAIWSAYEASLNPVSNIFLCVPISQKDECRLLIETSLEIRDLPVPISLRFDEEIIGEVALQELDLRFGTRAGWYAQQLIKLSLVTESKSLGVLVVDADTMLLTPRTWVTSDCRQILCPSFESHEPYVYFMKFMDPDLSLSGASFVSHHMLMQPSIVKEFLNRWGMANIDDLAISIANYSKARNGQDFFSEYETYASSLIHYHQNRALLVKWSNLSKARPQTISVIRSVIRKLREDEKYFSVSMHDYL